MSDLFDGGFYFTPESDYPLRKGILTRYGKKLNSKIISFFEMIKPDSEGRTLDDILAKSYEWMEFCHDYVQWLFPLVEESAYNPDAPLLTEFDIEYFRNNRDSIAVKNYIYGIEAMLAFFGIKIDSDTLVASKADNFESRKYTWAEHFNHNHLRMTRMLKSMMLLGFEDYAHAVYNFISDFPVNENSKQYWTEALQ